MDGEIPRNLEEAAGYPVVCIEGRGGQGGTE